MMHHILESCFSAVTPRYVWWDLLVHRYLHLFVGWRGFYKKFSLIFSDTHDESCIPCMPFKELLMVSLKNACTLGDRPPFLGCQNSRTVSSFTPWSPPSPPWSGRGGAAEMSSPRRDIGRTAAAAVQAGIDGYWYHRQNLAAVFTLAHLCASWPFAPIASTFAFPFFHLPPNITPLDRVKKTVTQSL